MSNSIIFVDIDGPLLPLRAHYIPENIQTMYSENGEESDKWFRSWKRAQKIKFDPVAVSYLNTWSTLSNAKLVMATNWIYYRSCQELEKLFKNNGIEAEFYPSSDTSDDWMTPRRGSVRAERFRQYEILEWLDRHPEIDNFLIIDDEPKICHIATENPLKLEEAERRLIGHIIPVSLKDGITYDQFGEGLDILKIDRYDAAISLFGGKKLTKEEREEQQRLYDKALNLWMSVI